MGTTRYVSDKEWSDLERLLMPENRAVVRLSLATGLRVSDCLALKKSDLEKAARGDGHISVKEGKTGKTRRIYIGKKMQKELQLLGGNSRYVFPHRFDKTRHRTREAVYRDIARAADALRLPGIVAPHSARKTYTVNYMRAGHSLIEAQRLLKHSSPSITVVYAFADVLDGERKKKKKKPLVEVRVDYGDGK